MLTILESLTVESISQAAADEACLTLAKVTSRQSDFGLDIGGRCLAALTKVMHDFPAAAGIHAKACLAMGNLACNRVRIQV